MDGGFLGCGKEEFGIDGLKCCLVYEVKVRGGGWIMEFVIGCIGYFRD